MNNLNGKVLEVIEENGFGYSEIKEQDGQFYVELNQYTPEGEDWHETIWFDGTDADFVKALRNRIKNFNIDEEVEKWIPSRGKNGVPEKISDLIKDAEWKLEELRDLCYELESVILEKKIKVEITMEKRQRVSMIIEVTPAELEQLKNGDNPFYEDADFDEGEEKYDYAVCDEDGEEIVPWMD